MFESLHQIFMSLIPVSFIIFLGWLAGYKNIVDKTHSNTFSTFVMSFSFPCGLFLLTANSKLSDLFNGPFVLAFWIGLIGMFLISFLIYKYILRLEHHECAMGAFVCAFPNMAFMGIPVFTSLLGQKSLLSIAIGNICTSLIMIPVVTYFMASRGAEKMPVHKTLLKVFTKPMVLAPVLGILFALAGLHLPDVASHTLNLISSTTSGTSLFALGLIMSRFPIKINKVVLMNIALKNVVHPAIMMGVILAFGLIDGHAKQAFLLCALPTATITAMFALQYDTLQIESTSSTILGTIVSFLTLSGCMIFAHV